MRYAKALEELYRASLEGGRLPEGTTTEEPLPAAVVLVEPAREGEGLRLSLTAPWGYDDAGRIRVPSLHLPGEWSPERVSEALSAARAEGNAIPAGAGVDVPKLPRCQVAVGTPEKAPSC